MTNHEIERKRREQRRLERLGDNHPVCVLCGENDSCCLEQHHIAGRKFDDAEAIICRNCHRKLSDDQRDHPALSNEPPDKLEQIGHVLLGLADLFRLLVFKLEEFGRFLIEMARGLQPSGT